MHHLKRHWHVVGIACLASLAAVSLAACGSSSSAAGGGSTSTATSKPAATTPGTSAAATGASSVDATLSEYKIAVTPAVAQAGHVVFHVTNTGKIKHQFTVISTSLSAAKVLSHKDPNDDIAGARGEIASIKPGKSSTLVIKKLKPGHYALVCALPGHYQAGMYADFTVN